MTLNSVDHLSHADTWILMCRWLSTLFAREISPDTLKDYRQGDGKAFLEVLANESAFRPEIKKLQKIIGQEKSSSDLALALAADFGFLFHGAGGPQSVPPYESAYTSDKGSLFQAAEKQTRKILEKHGLSTCEDIHEPADHIAVQLELLAHLGEASQKAMAAENTQTLKNEMAAFLENHLLNWVPIFRDHCARQDPGGFYAALTRLLHTFLQKTDRQITREH